jgi:nucleotide-binding universal stress UspA family protein
LVSESDMEIRKVLVPLDGESGSEVVLPYVVGLARKIGASLLLYRVVAESASDAEVAVADGYLEGLASGIRATGLGVGTAVQRGEPAARIIAARREYDAGLTVMTGHNQPGGRRDLIGSVAHDVLRNSSRPLLVLDPSHSDWIEPTAVVVGLDGSERAALSLAPATVLAKALGAEVILVRSEEPPAPLGGAARYYGTVDEHAEHYLSQVASELVSEGLSAGIALGGRSAEVDIVAAADARAGSIIAVSSSGLTGRPNVLGSTTDRIVRQGGHPVLVTPAH